MHPPPALWIYPSHALSVLCFLWDFISLRKSRVPLLNVLNPKSIWQSLQAWCAAVSVKKHKLYINRLTFLTGILSGGAEGEEIREEKGAEESLLPVAVREITSWRKETFCFCNCIKNRIYLYIFSSDYTCNVHCIFFFTNRIIFPSLLFLCPR